VSRELSPTWVWNPVEAKTIRWTHLPSNQGLNASSVEPCGSLWKPEKPYRGAAPALNDLIPGRVDSYFGSATLLENMRSGQIRGLGVTGLKRDPVAPELPTIAEAGVPGYEVSSWQGLFVPARTPPEIVKKMSVDTIEALADPAARRKLEQAGYPVAGSSPGELQALLRSDIDKWSHVIKTVGIKIN